MQNNDNKFINTSCHTTLYSWGIHIAFHYLKLIWISCNQATADGSSEGSGYCIANARSKATSCFAIWCECFLHRASCPSSERYWKGCRPSATGTSAHNDALTWLFILPTCVIAKNCEKTIARVWSASSSSLHWFSSHSYMWTFRREHFSPDFEGPFRPSRQLSKSYAREKNLDLQFAINISGNSPFGTSALKKNAERYEW